MLEVHEKSISIVPNNKLPFFPYVYCIEHDPRFSFE